MEATPELEGDHPPDSAPILVPQLEERSAENYFSMPFDQAPGLEALSAAATSNFQYIRPLSVAVHSPGDINTSPHSSNNLNFILNPTDVEGSISTSISRDVMMKFAYSDDLCSGIASPSIDPTMIASPKMIQEPKPVDDHEVAYLLRHFGETAGQW
jgi:hypothetical protein